MHCAGFYKGRSGGFAGGFIPFAKTKVERMATGDPRLSLKERYRDHAGNVVAVKKAVERLRCFARPWASCHLFWIRRH